MQHSKIEFASPSYSINTNTAHYAKQQPTTQPLSAVFQPKPVPLNSKKNFCKPKPLIVPTIYLDGWVSPFAWLPACPACLPSVTASPAARHRCKSASVQRQFARSNLAPLESGAHTFFDCPYTTAPTAPRKDTTGHSSPPSAPGHPGTRPHRHKIRFFSVCRPTKAIFS